MTLKAPSIDCRGLRVMGPAVLAVGLSVGIGRSDELPQPPGLLVRVGDSRLHVDCSGDGEPAVVFEAGLGGNSLDWRLVQTIVARKRRACAYDRPGAGWSERTTRPRAADVMAAELHDVAVGAGLTKPFVLVGHSFGGLLAQSYAARHREDVLALVLVDSVHPDQDARFSAAGVDLPKDPHAVLGHTPAAAAAYGLPPDLRSLAIDLAEAPKARIFVVRELVAMPAISAEVRKDARPSVPTRVLVHGEPEWDAAYPDGRMERAWRDMQADLARMFVAPEPTIVAGSTHQIPLDRPDAVADAIEAVIGQHR